MAMDPELLVTKEGMGNALCVYPGWNACGPAPPGT
jgi:hypothetical protein